MLKSLSFALAISVALVPAAMAQTAAVSPAASEWQSVPPENLLVIDTAKGRILALLEPVAAPQAVDRVRTLADQGFYDGLKFHRVIPGFMAQTGDPLGTGQGGSPLPDLKGEFQFRRGRDAVFARVATAPQGIFGVLGALPVVTQPDAQMMVTSDFKAAAQGLFCPGVLGMARSTAPDSANSQFFIMTGVKDDLNGRYTPFGRVLVGLDVVRALKVGDEAANGAVTDPDIMTRVRTAASLPAAQRPSVRVLSPQSPTFAAEVAQAQASRGAAFSVCDLQPRVEVVAP